VVAALSSVLFLGESLSATQVLGGCLVLAAILANVVLQHRVRRVRRPAPSHRHDASPAGRPAPIRLTVLTGFWGRQDDSPERLLRDPALADTVVIVNEFGEIGLDHLLIETADEDMILLSAGCLCCTVRGDLITTLEDLLRRRDNGRITPFRRVLIETTGLATRLRSCTRCSTTPICRCVTRSKAS
jgi:hypothetical protein